MSARREDRLSASDRRAEDDETAESSASGISSMAGIEVAAFGPVRATQEIVRALLGGMQTRVRSKSTRELNARTCCVRVRCDPFFAVSTLARFFGEVHQHLGILVLRATALLIELRHSAQAGHWSGQREQETRVAIGETSRRRQRNKGGTKDCVSSVFKMQK